MDNERTDELTDEAPPPPPTEPEPESVVDSDGEQVHEQPTLALDEIPVAAPRISAEADKSGMSRGGKIGIAVASLIVLLGIGYGGTAWYIQDKVPNNTSVGGVSIGGLASEAAISRINEGFAAREAEPVTVAAGERSTDLNPSELGLTVDAEAIVSPLVAFSLDPRDIWNHFVGLGDIDPVAAIDRDAAQTTLVSVLPDLEVEPVEGAIAFADGAAVVTDAVDAVRVDVPSSIDAIVGEWFFTEDPIELPTVVEEPDISAADVAEAMAAIVEPLLSGPVAVSAGEVNDELSPIEISNAAQLVPESGALSLVLDGELLHETLLGRNEAFASQGEDARIVISNGAPTIIPSKTGQKVDTDELADHVAAASVSREDRVATVEFVTAEPEFTTADAEALQVVAKVSEFSTPLTADNVRTRNLITGSEKISNTLILPGETFSLIDALGPVTAARGFVTSGVVQNGFYTTALGGGLSQLSTTTYNAAYFAGMDIVEHKPHSRWFSRYPEGREATMWAPDLDMKFKNSTPYGVLVQAWTEGGRQWVRFWSTEYYTVETHTGARYGITSPRTVYNSSPDCKPESGGQSGFSVNGWRKRFLNGEQYDHWDWSWTYQPWNNVVCGSEP